MLLPLREPRKQRRAGSYVRGRHPSEGPGEAAACQEFTPSTPSALISLDDAGTACSFQTAAQSSRLFRRREGTNQRAVERALLTEIGPANDCRAAAELIGILGLERAVSIVSFAFAALRRHLNRVAAAGRCRRRRVDARHGRRPVRRLRCPRPLSRCWRATLATGNKGQRPTRTRGRLRVRAGVALSRNRCVGRRGRTRRDISTGLIAADRDGVDPLRFRRGLRRRRRRRRCRD